jgi:hypothetical protein
VPLRKPTVSHEEIKQRTKIGKLNSVIYVFQHQYQENKIAESLPGAWRLCNLVAIKGCLSDFVSSHIPALFFFSGPILQFDSLKMHFLCARMQFLMHMGDMACNNRIHYDKKCLNIPYLIFMRG